MKKTVFILIIASFIFSGCSLREREVELEKKMAEINEKEQQLTLREQDLEFKELQLNERKKKLDSTSQKIANDSLYILHPELPGDWSVKMQCIETTCPGSAVGDTKNELWNITFQNNSILSTAYSNNKIVRVYNGTFTGNNIKLSVSQDSTDVSASKMTVRLQMPGKKAGEMEGEREIIQPDGCRILYSLQLKKK